MPKKLTKDEFIIKSKKIHGNTYDYSKVDYKNSRQKTKIICKKHGEFLQRPHNHLLGQKCPKCSIEIVSNLNTKSIYEFIEDANKIHNFKYDYSNVKYVSSVKKVEIICKKHGSFFQKPNTHLIGKGCFLCGKESKVKKLTKNTDYFITQAHKRHKNKYDYSKVDYISSSTPVKIICNKHGEFLQAPSNHLYGAGCGLCGYEKVTENLTGNISNFINRANKVHNFNYDYSLSEYINSKKKIKIICKEHGVFLQSTGSHLSGCGCPMCAKNSKNERIIFSLLKELKLDFTTEKTFKDCKNPITNKSLRFDFYLPKFNLCIENDGQQHFRPVNYFGGEKSFKEGLMRDEFKTKYCKNNNIKLIRFNYTQSMNEIKEVLMNIERLSN